MQREKQVETLVSSPSELKISCKICSKWLNCSMPHSNLTRSPISLHTENTSTLHKGKDQRLGSGFSAGKWVLTKSINLETHVVNLKNGNDLIMTSYEKRLRTMGNCIRKGTGAYMKVTSTLSPCRFWWCQQDHSSVFGAIVRINHAEPGNCYRYQQGKSHSLSNPALPCILHSAKWDS